jgi:glutathione peroxidase
MTFRQKLMKLLYPLIMKVAKQKATILEQTTTEAPKSFYNLQALANNGSTVDFANFKNKNVLIVNTASNCGFTNQYDALQQLYTQYNHNLIILGFPANDFKEQEKADDATIAEFCKLNFGVTFPLMQKSVVIKNEHQNSIYKWLSEAAQNGWNDKAPTWNFSKYLINTKGQLTHYFDPSIDPLDVTITQHLKA